MVLQFKSVVKSLVVMLTVPLGLIGAILGLATTHSPLGFMALLAMISLAGIMVSHIIVLSDYIEEARAKGLPLEEALVQAGLARLRPVLVTVLATVGGLIPLFLTGGALWHPLTAVLAQSNWSPKKGAAARLGYVSRVIISPKIKVPFGGQCSAVSVVSPASANSEKTEPRIFSEGHRDPSRRAGAFDHDGMI